MTEYIHYQAGKRYLVDGVWRTLIERIECRHQQVMDECCRFCNGYCKFDNGKVICGWTLKGVNWEPSYEKESG